MKKVVLGIALLSGLFACQPTEKASRPEMTIGNDIVGLASPIKLGVDTTEIHLLDYIEDGSLVDSISFSEGYHFTFDAYHGIVDVFVTGEAAPLSYMHLSYAGNQYTIPVFGSKRKPHHFSYTATNPNVLEIALKGNFNGWNPAATPLTLKDGFWECDLSLEPGLYEYLVVEDGVEMLDHTNPHKKSNGMGGENSTFQVGNPDAQKPTIASYRQVGDSVQVVYSNDLNDPLVLFNNQQIPSDWMKRESGLLSIHLPNAGAVSGRNFIRVWGADNSMRSNDVLIPLNGSEVLSSATEVQRTDQHAMRMYFMMVDRFVNGNEANDQKVDDPEILPIANYYGGDIQGVTNEIENAYFDSLSMNTIWLSPITQNPWTAYGLWDKGGVRSKFSGYHGYWPISSTQVDKRFGTEAELNDLITKAHAHNENVIIDYVANHVHEEHPVYQEHPDWATDLYLPDGSLNTERWDEYRLTTWFDTFMPTLNLEREDVTEAMTDSALYWFKNYNIDGFRHDATKHIPLSFWRTLTRKLKYEVVVPSDRSIYQVGETYGNPELIGSYIGSGMLDAQFDFNLYDAAVSTFAGEDGDFHELNRVLTQGLDAYGAHHLMGNISGNQDRTRFFSYADGSVRFDEDPKQAGWSRDIEPQGTRGYERLAMLHAFNFSVPGIPVIYYGDEFGMPGANDPDNRRMMRFGDELNENEASLLETTKAIAQLRKEHLALIYGSTEIIEVSNHHFAVARNYFDKTVITLFNISDQQTTMRIPLPKHMNVSGIEANFGHKFTVDAGMLIINLPPNSFDILTN